MIPTVGDWPPRSVIGAPSAEPPLTSEEVISGFLFFLVLGVSAPDSGNHGAAGPQVSH